MALDLLCNVDVGFDGNCWHGPDCYIVLGWCYYWMICWRDFHWWGFRRILAKSELWAAFVSIHRISADIVSWTRTVQCASRMLFPPFVLFCI